MSLLSIDAGGYNRDGTQTARSIGQPLLQLCGGAFSTTAGDYYGIGFVYAIDNIDKHCCETGLSM